MGVVSGQLENVAALCALSIGESEKEFAIEASKRAMQLEPANVILRANAAFIAFTFGDLKAAAALFAAVEEAEVLPDVYLGQMAVALASAVDADTDAENWRRVETLLRKAIESKSVPQALKSASMRELLRLRSTAAQSKVTE
jgi:hypothetical protein